MRKAHEDFSGDYRVMRVAMSSATPIETLHKIKNNEYSISTFLDMLEMLDMKATIEEHELKRIRSQDK